ncbi:XRE family transcriptional regulator [Streptomyces sp. cg35]|uniref:XRE family transcriptional regulator n=1 Tax=Streptomyces sp. cg35 TaxID=3421650 RepID=UPI003D18653C
MPRWKALPDELDPQVKEFASQLRRLVDRSGLGIAALSDRTGYSKTSWERYLNGRLLAPKGAIVALAEVTGTNPVHLTTMWELAERAWSRSEMRHDMTMEAIRISQARAALGEFGGPTAPTGGSRNGSATASRATGVAGPAGVAPTVPPQGSAPRADRFGPAEPAGPAAPGGAGGRGKRRLTMFFAGVLGAVLVVVVAYVLTSGGDGDKGDEAGPSAAPTTSAPQLPAGVQCVGAGCTGKDPEAMGCGGDLADSPTRAVVGTATVEVRYSKTCKAAWARVTGAAPGDSVQLDAGAKSSKKGLVGDADTDAYTPMVAVGAAADAKACVTLASGQKGCTE